MNRNKKIILSNLLNSNAEWTNGKGLLSDVVISSRIRLARNINNIPFTSRANEKELARIFNLLNNVFCENPIFEAFNQLLFNQLSSLEMQFLMEKNLISNYFLNINNAYRSCVFNQEETFSIMVNEEDHIRIHALSSGLKLKNIWEKISNIDNEIEKKVIYAFREEEGYLTTCPTNVGTGMRASVMLHLPALVIQNRIEEILQALSKIGYIVRGFYGEGSKAMGNLFQISNQVTLGLSEEEIIDSLIRLCKKIVNQEKNARKELLSSDNEKILDRVWRSYGLLRNARIISSTESMELLSRLRLGIELDIIPKIKASQINQLMLMIQPAFLQMLYGDNSGSSSLDFTRAEMIRKRIEP